MDRARTWFNARVAEPFKSYLKQGADPAMLARSSAVGFCTGLCPLLGVSAGLTVLFVFLSRGSLHGSMALLANLVSVPVELAMIVPYMRLGEWITGAPHQKLQPVALKDLFSHAPAGMLKAVARAILAWGLTLPLLSAALYFALLPAFQHLRRRYMRSTTAGSAPNLSGADSLTAGSDMPDSTPLLPVGISSDGSAGGGVASRRSSTSGGQDDWPPQPDPSL